MSQQHAPCLARLWRRSEDHESQAAKPGLRMETWAQGLPASQMTGKPKPDPLSVGCYLHASGIKPANTLFGQCYLDAF